MIVKNRYPFLLIFYNFYVNLPSFIWKFMFKSYDVLKQIIYNIKIRRALTRHDVVDFKQIIKNISKIKTLSVVAADKSYDSEDDHVLVRDKLKGFSIIPPRYNDVPVWKTCGKYSKKIKKSL